MEDAGQSVRLDIWLNIACLFKTRSQATLACSRGKILVNGGKAKAHRLIRPGDRIEFQQQDWTRKFLVLEVRRHSVARSVARLMYEDHSPPRPRRDPLERILRAPPVHREKGKGRPSKRERRQLEKIRGER